MKIWKIFLERMFGIKEYDEDLSRLASFLPWLTMIEEGIIINKNGSLQATLSYRGQDLSSSTKAELVNVCARVNNALVKLKGHFTLHIEARREYDSFYVKSNVNNIAGYIVEDEREKQFKDEDYLSSKFYMTILYTPEIEKKQKFKEFLIDNKSSHLEIKEWTDEIEIFKNAVNTISNNLSVCLNEVKLLSEKETLTYLHSIISTKRHEIELPITPQFINHYLNDSYLIGGLKPQLRDEFIKCISINSFPLATHPAFLDRLNRLNIEYRWVTRYIMIDKLEAEAILEKEIKKHYSGRLSIFQVLMQQLTNSTTPRENYSAISKAQEVEEQKFLVQQDNVGLGYYTTTIILKGKNEEILNEQCQVIEKEINALGFTTINEMVNCVEAWFGSIPGDLFHNIRRPLVNTLSLTHFMPLSSTWTGKKMETEIYSDKRKVPALLYCETAGKTPFCLNLKVGDVGHTVILGPTGSGKSTLLNTLAIQFSKYEDSQVFIFDKGASARVTTLGAGGDFYDLGAENNHLSFQPLRRIDSELEMEFANEWLQDIFIQANVILTPSKISEIYKTLDSMKELEPYLRTITTFSQIVQDEELRDSLRPFTIEGAYGRYFDNDVENFEGRNWMAFEMETIMKSKNAVVPLLQYIFHRIETDMLKGKPSIIILDECWVFFKNEQFSQKIEEWLRVLRKKKCDVVFATQSPKEIKTSSIYNVVIDSCQSKIFLPNVTAKEPEYIELYKEFTLNNKEIDIVQSSVAKRDYYYKSPEGSRLFSLNLAPKTLSYVASNSPQDQFKAKEIEMKYRHIQDRNKRALKFNKEWLKYKNIDISEELLKNLEMIAKVEEFED